MHEAADVANVPVLRSQLDAATAATTAEDLWDDQQVTDADASLQPVPLEDAVRAHTGLSNTVLTRTHVFLSSQAGVLVAQSCIRLRFTASLLAVNTASCSMRQAAATAMERAADLRAQVDQMDRLAGLMDTASTAVELLDLEVGTALGSPRVRVRVSERPPDSSSIMVGGM